MECDDILMKLYTCLSSLDVQVGREELMITIGIYRKRTFTSDCMKWSSFSPKSTKVMLISTLVHRVLKICSASKFHYELERLRKKFVDNSCQDVVVNISISSKSFHWD